MHHSFFFPFDSKIEYVRTPEFAGHKPVTALKIVNSSAWGNIWKQLETSSQNLLINLKILDC